MSTDVTMFDRGQTLRSHPLISSAHADGENRNVFEAFVSGFIGDLQPSGTIEATLAARAAGIAWRLNRAQSLETKILSRPDKYDQVTPLEEALARGRDREAIDMVSRWEQSLERSLYKTLDALEKAQRLRRSREKGGETNENQRDPFNSAPRRRESDSKRTRFDVETAVINENGK